MFALIAATFINGILHDELISYHDTEQECIVAYQGAVQKEPNLQYICALTI